MKRCYATIIAAIGLLATSAYPIGLQHALFRSQSTQGKAWTGTVNFVREEYTLTVYPDYLDVELEWELGVGGTPPDSFRNAIEIVGNVNLVSESAVVGMLLWNNDKLLKAKLKTNQQATDQYEQVVDRSSAAPPPPRDPVLFKYVRDDNYDLSIFPVTWGQTRTLRFRYLVPAFNVNGVNKIVYPYAFSPVAKVTIKNGAGVSGCKIEAGASVDVHSSSSPVALSASAYSFEAYSGTGINRPDYIVPVVPNYSDGSIFFMKGFRTGEFNGQMIHVAGLSAKDALQKALLKDDYVILWRWNHPDILKKYAHQIVAQSNLIKVFLATLEARNKRVALIIDMQGGETKVFKLDAKGGTVYQQMMDYLSGLSALADQQAPKGAPPAYTAPQIDSIVNASFAEFQKAITLAASLFDDPAAQRHLFILTAGPRWTVQFSASAIPAWDTTIDVEAFTSQIPDGSIQYGSTEAAQAVYWPGVDLNTILSRSTRQLAVYATVSNGYDTNRVLVQDNQNTSGYYYYYPATANEMRVYTSKPIKQQVKWSFYSGDRLLAEFQESPFICDMDDGMQYARLIGSSPEMVPLAKYMPSSLASTLGFVDQKYGLLALEHDTLSRRLTTTYTAGGVPTLNRQDMFPDSTEVAQEPVADWLIANPRTINATPVPGVRVVANFDMLVAVPAATVSVNLPAAPNAGVAIPMPIADVITANQSYSYTIMPTLQIDSVSAGNTAVIDPIARAASLQNGLQVSFKQKHIIVAFGEQMLKSRESMKLALYDMRGKLVKQWSFRDISADGRLVWSPNELRMNSGVYVLKVVTALETVSRQIMVR